MSKPEVPNEVLLEEIRLNRQEIRELRNEVGRKVGRGELAGALAALSAAGGVAVGMLNVLG